MKIDIIYDQKLVEMKSKMEEIKIASCNKKYIKDNNIRFYSNKDINKECDFYIVISNKYNQIKKWYDKLIFNKVQKDRIFIITGLADTSIIIKLIDLTTNLHYINTASEKIMDKIIKMNEKILYEI